MNLTASQRTLLARVVAYPGGLPYSHVGSRWEHFGEARVLLAAGLVHADRFAIVATEAGRGAIP